MKRLIVVLTVVLGMLGLTPVHADEVSTIDRPITGSSVGIQMFGWNWTSLAAECTNYLGPNGYDWVLTNPPQESITGKQWWTHYQPVSYKLDSTLGSREQFSKMVADCNAAGVKVITDAVINHMAGGRGLDFAPLYTASDFHSGLPKTDAHFCDRDISNWEAFDERTNCQFPGLPDLATEKQNVRQTIANYLNDQLTIGVSGFRIDAAKHIPPSDIAAIEALLIRKAYIVQEVPGDTSIAEDYLATGDVWAWKQQPFSNDMFEGNGFADAGKKFEAAIKTFTPSEKSLTWVTNHDTEHHSGAITYDAGKLYQMAFAWILSEPYGKPMLYSGYTFFDENADAPAGLAKCASSATVLSKYKDGVFTCVQRWTSLAGMIAWRDSVGSAAKTLTIGKSGVYAFARAKAGYVLFNSNAKTYSANKLKTGLAAGKYCDFYSGGKSPKVGKGCRGLSFTVAKDGTLTGKVPAFSVLAVSQASRY
ncbi:MAG: alpha-amylase family glycosyl hydrolase [Micrococcales bacterium]